MDTACSGLRPLLWALVLLRAAGLASAQQTPTHHLTAEAGETASLFLEVPQTSNFSSLLWRSSSRGSMEVVAVWSPESSLSVLGPSYSGRVTFLEDSWTLKIHNLSKADGGLYEVVEIHDPSDIVLQKYNLVVFKISTRARRTANGSCSLSLLCEAGAGAKTPAEASWGPGHKSSALDLTLHPADQEKSYTCTATALGTQHVHKVTPYKEACSSAPRAAGLLLLLGPATLLALLSQLL